MVYLKEHLIHQYEWPVQLQVNYTGAPSRRLFDRDNGLQVLFIINCFYESLGLTAQHIGEKLEQLIYSQLPLEMKSELAVFNWLKGVYLYDS